MSWVCRQPGDGSVHGAEEEIWKVCTAGRSENRKGFVSCGMKAKKNEDQVRVRVRSVRGQPQASGGQDRHFLITWQLYFCTMKKDRWAVTCA